MKRYIEQHNTGDWKLLPTASLVPRSAGSWCHLEHGIPLFISVMLGNLSASDPTAFPYVMRYTFSPPPYFKKLQRELQLAYTGFFTNLSKSYTKLWCPFSSITSHPSFLSCLDTIKIIMENLNPWVELLQFLSGLIQSTYKFFQVLGKKGLPVKTQIVCLACLLYCS